MNTLKKIAFSILASAFVFANANAGELSVTGSAKATYTILSTGSSTAGSGDSAGKGIGIANEFTLGASGELDNGFTWSMNQDIDGATVQDDKSIVIDELVGMWIALMPAIYFADTQSERTIIAILALILFRVFDILKPFPISYFDQRFKNGFGIVIDDVIAGIITLLILISLSY